MPPTKARASKTGILDAVRALDLDGVRAALAVKPDLLAVADDRGRNLLQLTCAMSPGRLKQAPAAQVRLAGFLLDRGMAIDEPYGRDRCTPLFEAVARARNIALVRFLLRRGARIDLAPGGGLFAAGWWEDLDILAVLLAAGAPIDEVADVTPFFACWGWKRFEAAKWFARHGADVDYQDKRGRTALYLGVEKDFDPALLAWLVRHGASPDLADKNGVSARAKAARKRDTRYLAAMGA